MVDAVDEIERGRESYEKRAWTDAYTSLSHADRTTPLGADDLELLATTAYMLGRDDEYLSGLERAHHAHLGASDAIRAVRCAIWTGISLATRGELGPAMGWLGRAKRLLERAERDCVERGYLLLPMMMQLEGAGNYERAYATAADAVAIADRFGDADLLALALHEQGRVLAKQGRVEEGLRLLDEAMVAVVAGELSPIVTGLIYCSVIEGCQEVYALRRAREWTEALTHWCEEQPDLVAFTGRCLMHRAEIMQLNGAWPDALEEAQQAHERCVQSMNQRAAAHALYRQGELHRLRGESAAAEDAYRKAGRSGWEPQPGLALLRLAQGNRDAAAAAIRRVESESIEPMKRAAMLPAYVEIMLAIGELAEARRGCRELEEISATHESDVLAAIAAHARGAVELAEGNARAALVAARRASHAWQELGTPYEAARARVLIGLGCRALGDEESSALELAGARDAFAELGAAPDVARVDSLTHDTEQRDAHGLTSRELQVLRLAAAGKTNKAIARELVLSERTVDRHVSNIFRKLRVSSRAAATAYAYEHELLETH